MDNNAAIVSTSHCKLITLQEKYTDSRLYWMIVQRWQCEQYNCIQGTENTMNVQTGAAVTESHI